MAIVIVVVRTKEVNIRKVLRTVSGTCKYCRSVSCYDGEDVQKTQAFPDGLRQDQKCLQSGWRRARIWGLGWGGLQWGSLLDSHRGIPSSCQRPVCASVAASSVCCAPASMVPRRLEAFWRQWLCYFQVLSPPAHRRLPLSAECIPDVELKHQLSVSPMDSYWIEQGENTIRGLTWALFFWNKIVFLHFSSSIPFPGVLSEAQGTRAHLQWVGGGVWTDLPESTF